MKDTRAYDWSVEILGVATNETVCALPHLVTIPIPTRLQNVETLHRHETIEPSIP